MTGLEGRVAVVTGGARGMGASHVRALTEAGAQVVLGDVLDEDGAALAGDLAPGVRFAHLDVTREEDWTSCVALAEREFGPISVLVNNAGITSMAPLVDTTLADWQRVIDVNLTGTFLGMRAVAPSMRRAGGGSIVNVSSMGGLVAIHPSFAYTASKWGVRGLTKAAAIELGGDGIRVNSIHPGMIKTAMIDGADESAMAPLIPMARFGDPDEVARLVLYLVSDATYSTGSEFAVDGGILAGIRAGG